jgi:hypothetical protein
MIYTEYKKAAEKHLKTCKAMLESINRLSTLDNSSLIVTRCKQDTLHNIYYLLGYTLEGISTYSIYKHFQWPIQSSVKTNSINVNFSSRSNFTFYPKQPYMFCAHGHAFQVNQFEVLKATFSNSSIPIIDSSISVDLDILALFNQWSPELRYHESIRQYNYLFNTNIQVDIDKMSRLTALTESIHNSLLQIVG